MQRVPLACVLILSAAVILAPIARAEEPKKWSVDASLYFLGAGMDGEVGIAGASADLDVDFSDVLENLEFGAMAFARVGRDRWAFTTEVVFMGLAASKDAISADFDQWLVEPRLSYRASPYLDPFVGVRYNNLSGEIRGSFGRSPSGTQDWLDPILGADFHIPATRELSFVLHGDIGGFGAGSDLTWQLFPYAHWRFAQRASLQAGYRLFDTDYETGSGSSEFRYDVLTHGPQLGVTFHF